MPRPETRREATAAEARALASPLRLRILRVCLHEPRTNKEIAGLLDRDPASTLHHVRTLVDTGFLEALPARRGTRGSREIPYHSTGKSWTVANPGTSRTLLDTFLDEVSAVPAEQLDTTRLGLRLTEDEHAEFVDRLQELFEEFYARRNPDGTAWSVFLALHPDPNNP